MSTVKTAPLPSPRRKNILRPFRRQRYLTRLVREADFAALTPDDLAKEMRTFSPSSIDRLRRKTERIGDRLLQKGVIDRSRRQELARFLVKIDPLILSEGLSDFHKLLSDHPFYSESDAPTRLMLRRSAVRFARRHRLPPESAALLWKGETAPSHRKAALFLLLPLLPMVAAAWIGFRTFPLPTAFLLLLTLPTVFTGGYLCVAALLRKCLSPAPLPMLNSGAGHPLLTVGVGTLADADRALEGIARVAAAGQSDARYLLVLNRSSGLLREEAGEAEQIADVGRRVNALAHRLDLPITWIVPPRRYEPRSKRWRGKLTLPELAALLAEKANEITPAPQAICILPADAAILPGSDERLSAALFHPLCKQDALVFLAPAGSPLPSTRLTVLRQCLLQKLDAPADLVGWGIYRKDALNRLAEGSPLSPRLTAQPLYSAGGCEPPPYAKPLRQSPSLLPLLKWLLPALRMILLFGMVALSLPIRHCTLLWLIASADLGVSALLALRPGRRFFLYTLPAWKRLGRALFLRTLLPVGELWEAAGVNNLMGLCVTSLLFGGLVIVPGVPLSVLGLCWSIAPLLITNGTTDAELTPVEKGACHALAKELYPLLRESGEGLPPAYLTASRERASYTTPAVMGSVLAAEIAACDLGLIDPYTLERRVDALLCRLEKLPTRGGLPYARYGVDVGDSYKDSRVDTVECGVYALCLAAAEAGLLEYAAGQPGLYAQAKRIAHLSAQMDFSLLLQEEHILCRGLTSEGERQGELSYLFGGGGLALFAALSSDSTLAMGGGDKVAAWQKLRSPAVLQKGQFLLQSEDGKLESFLLPGLLLPAPPGSLIRYATQQAIRSAEKEGSRTDKRAWRRRLTVAVGRVRAFARRWIPAHPGKSNPPRQATASALSAAKSSERSICIRSLTSWSRLSHSPKPLSAVSHTPCTSDDSAPLKMTAPVLCLLLKDKPRLALAHLRKLQESDRLGGFAHSANPQQLPLFGLAISLIALGGAATDRSFADRLMKLPRCGGLYPFLCRRPDSAVEGSVSWRETPSRSERSPYSPSVCLLGDASHGLLIAKGIGLSLWEAGAPLTASAAVNGLFVSGKLTGLLVRQEGKLIPLPDRVIRREAGLLTLGGDGMTCTVQRTKGGWSISWERSDAPPAEVRFLLCPAGREPMRLSQQIWENDDRSSTACLFIERSPTLTIAASVTGISDAFTHADPSPFPRGSGQTEALFRLPPKRAEGFCSTPSCMIGGRTDQKTLTVRIVIAADKRSALSLLHTDIPVEDTSPAGLPLPAPDGSPASKVLEWLLHSLFAAAPIPAVMAVSGEPDHFARCIRGGTQVLTEKGFPRDEKAPTPLTVSRREGAQALINRLLSAEIPDAQTPLLPPSGSVAEQDGAVRIVRGRDTPHLSRTYCNRIATLYADPESPGFRPYGRAETISISLLLTKNEKRVLLPAASTVVTYSPGEAIFEGEDFTLQLALLPKLPLLAIRLTAKGNAELTFPSLPPPHKEEDGVSIRYRSDGQVLFCRRLSAEDGTVWLIGSFPRANDHLYYWTREAITLRSLPRIMESCTSALRSAASLLQVPGERPPALSATLAAVLATDSPVRALLTPLCAPADATADLIRLAKGEPTLLLPMALALRIALDDDPRVADLRIPVNDGRTSLYLLAARCLERAMEEDGGNPLLPPLTAAFARLAERLGDHTGKELYAAFESQGTALSDRKWNSLPEVSDETVELLAALWRGDEGSPEALWDALTPSPEAPSAADAALLWSGALWGVLGFIPARDGFTLAPLSVGHEITFLLSYKGNWRIRLRPGEAPFCTRADLPEGKNAAEAQKIFRNRNISEQNGCIVHKNVVK